MEKIQSAYQFEQQQLKKNAAEITRQLTVLEEMPRYFGDDLTEQALEDVRERTRESLRLASNEAYFGRLDFQEEGNENAKPLYIGKAGVADQSTADPMIIDWRAPVSSMFYSFTGGEEAAFYQSPEGLIEGDIHLKRSIAIRQQNLLRVVDTYVKGEGNESATDEFLLYRLGENKDNRLRDIVSTIQAEQNDIIRTEKNTPLIIQGVAGSGKTTVALHRLAYLIYEYREHLLPEKMIIFAPNAMFLDYISNVLPALGVGGIQQTTFGEWALDLLEHEIQLNDTTEQLAHWFSLDNTQIAAADESIELFKGSMQFKEMIEDCLVNYETTALPDKDFEAWEGSVLSVEKIRSWYIDQKKDPLAKRRERITTRIKNWVDSEVKKVPERHRQKELKKKAGQRLRTYLKSWPKHTAVTFYQSLFNEKKQPEYVPETFLNELPTGAAYETLKSCKMKKVNLEDLAPLVFIHQRLNGIERKEEFHHTVLDEAQDFSPFQISVLKDRTRSRSFTILGDLSQGIHDYQGIRTWDEFKKVFNGQTGYFELKKSYRSTMEIIRFANAVLSAGSQPVTLAEPVFRSGNDVKIISVSADQRISSVIQTVKNLQKEEIHSVAVVGRTEEECQELYYELKNSGLSAHLITASQQDYSGGLSVVPVYLTKGLEFDAVLIIDADAEHYPITERNAKLLYVGCTRALHDLHVFFTGECSPILEKALALNNVKILELTYKAGSD